jgi:hypothetical protein
MDRFREFLKNPVVAWTAAVICIAVAFYSFFRSVWSRDVYDTKRLGEAVTVRFTDTNDEIHLTRAEFEKRLRETPGVLSPETGILNPKTNKPTGILVAEREWKEVVDRLNAERQWAKQHTPFGDTSAAAPQVPPKPAGER